MEVAMAGSSTKRVQKYWAKMKAAGLKRVTICVPDVNAPGFREQVARDIEVINNSAEEKIILRELSGENTP
jgi:hypothetical protein